MSEISPLSQLIGIVPPGFYGMTSYYNLNAASNQSRVGIQFFVQEAKVLSQLDVYVYNCYGTQANRKGVAYIYSCSSTGYPDTLVTNGTSNEVSNIAASSWLSFTWSEGSRPSLSANTLYWIVLANTADASSTDYWSVRTPYSNYGIFDGGGITNSPLGFYYRVSSDGGSSWTSGMPRFAFFKLTYDDGTFGGMPIEHVKLITDLKVYGANEAGVQFTLPSNFNINVVGLRFNAYKYGSPDNIELKLYSGETPSLLGSTNNMVQAIAASGSPYDARGYFSSAIQIAGGTVLTITIHQYGDGGSASAYYEPGYYTMKDDTESIAMIPFSAQALYYNGSSWTLMGSRYWMPFGLILSPGNEFYSSGSGGSGGGGHILGRSLVR